MKCRHCKFMEKSDHVSRDTGRRLRYCRIKLPGQIKSNYNIQVYLRDGCDLGQPKEERRKENL